MKKKNIKFYLILLFPISILLTFILSKYPQFVEKYYSQAFFAYTVLFISKISGVFSFSLAELGYILLILFGIYFFIYSIIKAIKNKRFKFILDFFSSILAFASVLYFLYIILWGLNYYRIPFPEKIGLELKPSSISELNSLCQSLADRANSLRSLMIEDENGVSTVKGGYTDILERANMGFINIKDKNSVFGFNFGRPKGIYFSKLMSYSGICGVYCPYTGEPNVDIDMPLITIPSTICHEMAHQRGYSREDEANYISYLACINHPDNDFKYSGVVLALQYSIKALSKVDKDKYTEVKKSLSSGVLRDLQFEYDYWHRHDGVVENVSNNINNLYLKSNGQGDGVQSYGRIVDILLAEYKKGQ